MERLWKLREDFAATIHHQDGTSGFRKISLMLGGRTALVSSLVLANRKCIDRMISLHTLACIIFPRFDGVLEAAFSSSH